MSQTHPRVVASPDAARLRGMARHDLGPRARAREVSSTAAWVVLSIMVLSTLERLSLSFQGYNFSTGQVLALVALPSAITAEAARVRRQLGSFLAIFVALTVPALIAFGPGGRLVVSLQLALNLGECYVVYALGRQCSGRQLRRIVDVVATLLLLGSIVQVTLFPGLAADAAGGTQHRFYGLARPIIAFQEPTWLGVYAALVLVAGLMVRARSAVVITFGLSLAVFTRAAMATVLATMWVAWRSTASRFRHVVVIAAVVWAYAVSFVYGALTVSSKTSDLTSLDSRRLDILAVRFANPTGLWVFGAPNLSIFDATRSRTIPRTSNVLFFDLYWKFGIFGILAFAVIAWFLVFALPRAAGLGRVAQLTPFVVMTFALLPAVMIFDNCFGRAWFWAAYGLLLACTAQLVRRQEVRDDGDLGPDPRSQEDAEPGLGGGE